MSKASNGALRAVVLAAGQGKRMKSALPKVLHEVLGRPIISRVLAALDELELEHIHIVLGHGGDEIEKFLQTNPPRTAWSTAQQEPQLGTGHALMQVAPQLTGFEGTLLVTVADTPLLTAETLLSLYETHRQKKAVVTALTAIVDDAKSYGRILRNQAGHIVGIIEDKDATPEQRNIREINTGIYCLAWPATSVGLDSLKNDNQQKEYYLTDIVGWAAANEMVTSGVPSADWREVSGVNSRLDLSDAERMLRDRTVRKLALDVGVTFVDPEGTWIAPEVTVGEDSIIRPGCFLMGQIEIGRNCVIGPNTVMHGPVRVGDRTTVSQSLATNCVIGSDCKVGPFSHLREGAFTSDGVRIGNFVEIKKSTIGSRTNVSHLSYVGDTEIGSQSNIGAGTITANYDHITKVKAKTVIGDGASTGSNSVLVAPVVIGKEASVAAGTVVTKDVPDGALAVGRARQENKAGWAETKRRQSQKAVK